MLQDRSTSDKITQADIRLNRSYCDQSLSQSRLYIATGYQEIHSHINQQHAMLFQIVLSEVTSRERKLKNGQPQGFILPTFFT